MDSVVSAATAFPPAAAGPGSSRALPNTGSAARTLLLALFLLVTALAVATVGGQAAKLRSRP